MEEGFSSTSKTKDPFIVTPVRVPVSLFDMLELVPLAVKGYLLGKGIEESRTKSYVAASLNDDERDIALDTELRVFFGEIPIADFADELWTRLDWPVDQEDRAAQLAADILGQVFFPVKGFVGDVASAIEDLGFDASFYPHTSVTVREETFSDATNEVLLSMPDLSGSVETRKRAQKVIESFLRGIRDDLETAVALEKAGKVGGPGLTPVQSKKAIDTAKKLLGEALLVESIAVVAEKPFPPERIRAIYAGSPIERQRIEELTESIGEWADGALTAVAASLEPQNLKSEPLATAVALIVAAERGVFFQVFADDGLVRETVLHELETRGLIKEKERFTTAPADLHSVNVTMQLLLRRLSGLSDADSARLALRIFTILKKQGFSEYAAAVAFDPEKETFVWTEPVDLQ